VRFLPVEDARKKATLNSDPAQSPVPESLDDVLKLLKMKAQELLFAQPNRVSALQQEIQKLRIVASLFREIEGNVSDADLYKEMNLLNRMMVGRDLDTEADRRKAEEHIIRTSQKLKDNHGMSPASAHRIAKVLGSVVGGNFDEPGDVPEPIDFEPDRPKPS
jgi:hypothetical protein